ncbi:hypothetical protein BJ742DRAFT_905554 [Cladochytrium replicatum]|nr:hypothetical protein BJ742DRAFT_776246 [Cladochytrium replicatum]KAI8804392.1 hypothetical protein BJ742DRAFT_905554 [Cladochytrium replicatum]
MTLVETLNEVAGHRDMRRLRLEERIPESTKRKMERKFLIRPSKHIERHQRRTKERRNKIKQRPRSHLKPAVHLLQFLRVISSVRDLSGFVETMAHLDGLTMAQVRRAMLNYRWEVGEETFPTEVQLHVQKILDDLSQWHHQLDSTSAEDSPALIELARSRAQRGYALLTDQYDDDDEINDSISGGFASARDVSQRTPKKETVNNITENLDETDVFSEFLDSSLMLPFHVPIILNGDTALVDETWPGAALSPSIPEEVMKKLDVNDRETTETTQSKIGTSPSGQRKSIGANARGSVLSLFGWKNPTSPISVGRSRSPSSPLRNITNAADFGFEFSEGADDFGEHEYRNS